MMKSPLVGSVTAPARALEADWRTDYAEAQREYEAGQERTRLDNAVWAESYSEQQRNRRNSRKPELAIIESSQRRLIAVDVTFESLHQLLAENPAGVFVIRDELTGWLASLERQGRESERSFYLECWNGDTRLSVDRIGRGSIHVEHCCVSLFGGISTARLRAYLADALRDGPSNDGLIQRFQLLVWPDTKKELGVSGSPAGRWGHEGGRERVSAHCGDGPRTDRSGLNSLPMPRRSLLHGSPIWKLGCARTIQAHSCRRIRRSIGN